MFARRLVSQVFKAWFQAQFLVCLQTTLSSTRNLLLVILSLLRLHYMLRKSGQHDNPFALSSSLGWLVCVAFALMHKQCEDKPQAILYFRNSLFARVFSSLAFCARFFALWLPKSRFKFELWFDQATIKLSFRSKVKQSLAKRLAFKHKLNETTKERKQDSNLLSICFGFFYLREREKNCLLRALLACNCQTNVKQNKNLTG